MISLALLCLAWVGHGYGNYGGYGHGNYGNDDFDDFFSTPTPYNNDYFSTPTPYINPNFNDYHNHEMTQSSHTSSQQYVYILAQIVFAVAFYFLVAKKYRAPTGRTQSSTAIMREDPSCRCPCGVHCLHAYFCPGASVGLIVEKTGLSNYWVGCLISSFFPCLFLWMAQSFSEVRPALGGDKKDCFSGCFESMFCSWCLSTQLLQAMDAATGQELECLNVATARAREGDDEYHRLGNLLVV